VQYTLGETGVVSPSITFVVPEFITSATFIPGTSFTSNDLPGDVSGLRLDPSCQPTVSGITVQTPDCDLVEIYGPLITSGPLAGQYSSTSFFEYADGAFATPGTYLAPTVFISYPLTVADLTPPGTAVPEPWSLTLFIGALGGLTAVRRRSAPGR